MTNWAPTTDQVIDHGFGESRYGAEIEGIIPHHVAGTDGLAYVANANSRNSHPTYHIARSGKVTGIVHPNRRPYSTAHEVDRIAVTVEMDNESTGGDWPITHATMEALLEVALAHEAQSKKKGFAKNRRGVDQSEFFVGLHSQYHSTACPGPYVTERWDWIVAELNRRKAGGGGSPKPPTKPSVPPKPGGGKLFTTAVNDGAPGYVYWTLVQQIGRKLGLYPAGYDIDGVPGPKTIQVETILLARILNGMKLGKTTSADKDGDPYNGGPGAFSNFVWMGQKAAKARGWYNGDVDGIDGPNSRKGRVRLLAEWLNKNA